MEKNKKSNKFALIHNNHEEIAHKKRNQSNIHIHKKDNNINNHKELSGKNNNIEKPRKSSKNIEQLFDKNLIPINYINNEHKEQHNADKEKIKLLELENQKLKEKLEANKRIINTLSVKIVHQNKKLVEYKNKLKDLKAIIQAQIADNAFRNNNNSNNINTNQNNNDLFNSLNGIFLDNFYDDKIQEQIALQAVDQQIIDDICPNPDAMTYEQLLQLEEQVGKVNKGLSKANIEKLPIVNYISDKYKDNFQCIICMEAFQKNEGVRKLPCNHIFHKECIAQWLISEKTCPFCKKEIIIN